MKFKELNEGQVFKSYRQVCEFLGEDIKSGNSKIYQIREWDRHFKYELKGNKYIVTEVYNLELEKEETRGRKANLLISISPSLITEWNSDKNGEIPEELNVQDTNYYWWICNTCNHDVYSSTKKRFHSNKPSVDENISYPYCWSSKGSKMIYKALNLSELMFNVEHSFDDLIGTGNKKLRFDYAIIDNDDLIALIEFDGEYHDVDETLMIHDKLKDEYCKENCIPLLRIHHTEKSIIYSLLFKFLKSINLKINLEYLNDESLKEMNLLDIKKEKLMNETNYLNSQIDKVNNFGKGEC